jgi:hypothetical protein
MIIITRNGVPIRGCRRYREPCPASDPGQSGFFDPGPYLRFALGPDRRVHRLHLNRERDAGATRPAPIHQQQIGVQAIAGSGHRKPPERIQSCRPGTDSGDLLISAGVSNSLFGAVETIFSRSHPHTGQATCCTSTPARESTTSWRSRLRNCRFRIAAGELDPGGRRYDHHAFDDTGDTFILDNVLLANLSALDFVFGPNIDRSVSRLERVRACMFGRASTSAVRERNEVVVDGTPTTLITAAPVVRHARSMPGRLPSAPRSRCPAARS